MKSRLWGRRWAGGGGGEDGFRISQRVESENWMGIPRRWDIRMGSVPSCTSSLVRLA